MKELREPLWIAWGLVMAALTVLGIMYHLDTWFFAINLAIVVIAMRKVGTPFVLSMEDGIRRRIADPIEAQRLIDRRLNQASKAVAITTVSSLALVTFAPWRFIGPLTTDATLYLIVAGVGLFLLGLMIGVARLVRRRL